MNSQERVLVKRELDREKAPDIHRRSSLILHLTTDELMVVGNYPSLGGRTTEKEQMEHVWSSYRAGNSAPTSESRKYQRTS